MFFFRNKSKLSGEQKKLLESYFTALKKDPADALTHFRVAELHDLDGRPDDAIAAYAESVRCHVRAGFAKKAAGCLKAALKVHPDAKPLLDMSSQLGTESAEDSAEGPAGSVSAAGGGSFDIDLEGLDDLPPLPAGSKHEDGAEPEPEAPATPMETESASGLLTAESPEPTPEPESAPAPAPEPEPEPEPEPVPPPEPEPVLDAEPVLEADVVEDVPADPPLHANTDWALLAKAMLQDALNLKDPAEAERLLEASRAYRLAAGMIAVEEGSEDEHLYLILAGEMEVTSTGPDGAAIALGVLHDGDLFGEVSFLKRVPRTATVTSVGDGVILQIQADSLREFLSGRSAPARHLEKVLLERVERTIRIYTEA